MNSPKARLWLMVLLLWIALFVRIHHVTVLPPFNDESHHIRRAEIVWSFDDPDTSLTLSKLLTYYWYGFFGAERLDAIWVARTVTGLFALIGLAASLAVGRRLFGAWVGILALYLLAFAPFMVFFDRMALTDPFTASIGMVMVWVSLLMLPKSHEWEWGVLAGVVGWLTILAKLTALPFLAFPIWAILTLTEGGLKAKWQRYRASLIACYTSFALLISPFILRILYKEATGNRISVVDTHLINTKSPVDTVLSNLEHLQEANWVFNNGPWMALGFIVMGIALYYRPRQMGFIVGGVLMAWSVSILAGGVLSTRYLVLGIPLLFVAIAGAWGTLLEGLLPSPIPNTFSARAPLAMWGIASVWIFFFAQPFILNAWNDPRQNDYPTRDRWEYFTNFTSGYGLVDTAKLLPTLTPSEQSGRVEVLGILGSCHQMRLYLPEDELAHLECLEFDWLAEDMVAINAYILQRAEEESLLYLLVEPDLSYVNLDRLEVSHQVIGRFARPFNGMTIELWQVSTP